MIQRSGRNVMKATVAALTVVLVVFAAWSPAGAENMKDRVKVEVSSVGLHPGMDPGMYVCALGHLHIKGTVQNQAGVPLGHIKVAGKAFGPDGKLLGTATASTKPAVLRPDEKAEINVEFLTVTGPQIQTVTKHEITVVDAPTAVK
jgi:hypothetical protein